MKLQSVESAKDFLSKRFPHEFIEKGFKQFPQNYFEDHPLEMIERHFNLLDQFEKEFTPQFSVVELEKNQFNISLVCFDFLGLFSMVAGLFSSYGFNIIRGIVLTIQNTPSLKRKNHALISLHVEVKAIPAWDALKSDLQNFLKRLQVGEAGEVRRELNTRIVRYFRTHQESYLEKLYPIQLEIDQAVSTHETVVAIRTQDTAAFLYELTSALSALTINIVRMEISTKDQTVEDRLWLTTETGEKITSPAKLKELRWAILLVKHFTHLLPKVPDPVVALDQMALFGKEIFEREDFEQIFIALEKGEALGSLSKIFGSSRFLWEEFIRTQHESLIPLLGDRSILGNRKSKLRMMRELAQILRSVNGFQGKVEVLNAFKDREMFRIDARHLLRKTSYLEEFAEEFTDLCEVVVATGYHLSWEEVLKTFPLPMADEKTKSEVSILALGKFGGRELGYASDLELLFVYTDDRDTSSVRSQKNLEFFTELVRQFRQVIWAREEGVFEIDLRLRPHGKDGPLAASLELFKNYYSEHGGAWSYERQALVKLRAVAGSPWLGKEVERLRDEFVYGKTPFNLEEVVRLRERQRGELVKPGVLNAKYSLGGLLDIEYLVQILQIAFGQSHESLHQTNTLKAMRVLWQEGVLDEAEFQSLRASYIFIRDLINALRIFRGNAKDLTIPKREDLEFTTLARRVGYEGSDEVVQKKLEESCAHAMKVATEFYERWTKTLSRLEWKTIGELKVNAPRVFRPSLDELLREKLSDASWEALRTSGFSDTSRAVQSIKRLYPGSLLFEPFAKTFDRMWDIFPQVPDADRALQHFEQLSEYVKDKNYFWELLSLSREGLQTLLTVFGSSHYLSELIYTRAEETLPWILDRSGISLDKTKEAFLAFQTRKKEFQKREEWLDALRELKNRETLRTALCELEHGSDLDSIWHTYSNLAYFILEEVFSEQFRNDFCVIGLGKLGGEELNFSSDVDLMFVAKALPLTHDAELIHHIQRSVSDLSKITSEGFLYRVDLRLRPHGTAGTLAMADQDTFGYYEKEADAWEHQMLIKARAVACDQTLGKNLISKLDSLVYEKEWRGVSFDRLREVKRRYEAQTRSRGEENSNIKMGLGGIRDAEFSIQALQLFHAKARPQLKTQNTLEALRQIEVQKLLSEQECHTLRKSYSFLRRVENKLHLEANRQTFVIPTDRQALRRLARSLGFSDETHLSAEDTFERELRKVMAECREIFERIFFG
ncbi:MAG: hypothetical protein HY582_04010 [Candidatus Omnitrophica bacterium]|nr:hypothetical protein [Candidatus Omnitrophota bacterium]